MLQNPIRRSDHSAREGKALVGCLIALGVAILLAIIATVVVFMNISKIVGWGFEKGTNSLIAQLPIDAAERDQVISELSGLMDGYKNKELDFQELATRLETVINSPSVQAGLLSSAASSYINASPLSDEEKAAGENELQRLALGILDGTIDPDVLRDILEPLHSDGSSGDTLTLGVHISGTGKEEYKILKPSAVTTEQITRVIESAKAKADEAGVDENPPAIDLSDEIKKTLELAETEPSP